MRLVLWILGLIFLHVAYCLEKFIEVTNYDQLQNDGTLPYTEEKSEHLMKQRFPSPSGSMNRPFHEIDNIVSERFYEKLPIRHKKHNDKKYYLKARVSFDKFDNDLKTSKDKDAWKKNAASEKSAGFYDTEQNDGVPAISSVSQMKLQTLGNEEKVNERFQATYGTVPSHVSKTQEMKKAANSHYEDMKRRTLCRLPIPKIVRVDDVYPNVLKTYFPPCTIIHQCSEESGCCVTKNMKCTPYATQNVTLYFLVVTKIGGSMKETYEGLSFMNHTECRCQLEPDRKIREASSYLRSSSISYPEGVPKSYNISYLKKCPLPCPVPFSHRFMANGDCICECNDQDVCLKYKTGEIHFSFKDKYCLFTNQCIYPSCAYGNYLTQLGRCPKQHERRDSY